MHHRPSTVRNAHPDDPCARSGFEPDRICTGQQLYAQVALVALTTRQKENPHAEYGRQQPPTQRPKRQLFYLSVVTDLASVIERIQARGVKQRSYVGKA
jgi:hypothetical protein